MASEHPSGGPASPGPGVNLVNRPAALVVAHPGHEVRLHGWLAAARPSVSILTDGSGRSGRPRLDSTSAYLREIGVEAGELYGRFSDRNIYEILFQNA